MRSALMKYVYVLIAGVLLAGAGVAGYRHWANVQQSIGEARATERYNQAISKQKAEAAVLLAKEAAKTEVARQQLAKLISNLEKDREKLQAKNRDDLRTRATGPRLQFTAQTPGCGRGSGSAQAGESRAANDPGTTTIQLPEPLNRDLLELAADAQSPAIDYPVLYEYVNDSRLVCDLR